MAAIAILILDPLLGLLVLLVVPLFAVSYIALRGRLEDASAARQKLKLPTRPRQQARPCQLPSRKPQPRSARQERR